MHCHSKNHWRDSIGLTHTAGQIKTLTPSNVERSCAREGLANGLQHIQRRFEGSEERFDSSDPDTEEEKNVDVQVEEYSEWVLERPSGRSFGAHASSSATEDRDEWTPQGRRLDAPVADHRTQRFRKDAG